MAEVRATHVVVQVLARVDQIDSSLLNESANAAQTNATHVTTQALAPLSSTIGADQLSSRVTHVTAQTLAPVTNVDTSEQASDHKETRVTHVASQFLAPGTNADIRGETRITSFSMEILSGTYTPPPPPDPNQVRATTFGVEVLSSPATEPPVQSEVRSTLFGVEVLSSPASAPPVSSEVRSTLFGVEVLSSPQAGGPPVVDPEVRATTFGVEVLSSPPPVPDDSEVRTTLFGVEVIGKAPADEGPPDFSNSSGSLEQLTDYWRDLYGEATIGYVPPVSNYRYHDNKSKRGYNDNTFRWEEVAINLDNVPSGAVLDFVMPDMYIVQITPDLGWHEESAMFGEADDLGIINPHLVNFGPFSIENGTLTDNADNSVSVQLTGPLWSGSGSPFVEGYTRYLWRAVPWAHGNPGMGGKAASFEFVNSVEQLEFTVDTFIRETKRPVQVISGTKSPRVSITIEEENNPAVFVTETPTTWQVSFAIDRSHVRFTIVATDSGGASVGKYIVDLEYESFSAYNSHVWNSFDHFAIMAGLDRLPGETNEQLKERIIDSFVNKASSTHDGLFNGIPRTLGLRRRDGLKLVRNIGDTGIPHEDSVHVEILSTRVGITASSFVINDEIKRIDKYLNTVVLDKRIDKVIQIKTHNNNVIPESDWEILDTVDGNEIRFDEKYSGDIKISYKYIEDIKYSDYPTVGELSAAITNTANPAGINILKSYVGEAMGGSERAAFLRKGLYTISKGSDPVDIPWAPVGLFAVSDQEYKWSFADDKNTFFNSKYFRYVKELKSRTNIEWGYVVADKDFWDAIDADSYGRDSIPIIFDLPIANYTTSVNTRSGGKFYFDPWEAFRMGYYYEHNLIKNTGMPREVFRSGVGFKQDCAVSVKTINIKASESKINQNPVTSLPDDIVDFGSQDVSDIIITF
ncbi:MAG: hypothetical protein D6710_01895 [Nitrospirae bacterium]|nr:MAG: hypothetical protein D6710_01895 [Nitrospirota bacterium]